MVIDSSAMIAILLGEPEAERMARVISQDTRRLTSSLSVLETGIVIEVKKGELGGKELDLLLHRANIEVVSFTAELTEQARKCWRKFGKGRHPVGLNLGDCCSYALARFIDEPLLFKGDDFSKTDIKIVHY